MIAEARAIKERGKGKARERGEGVGGGMGGREQERDVRGLPLFSLYLSLSLLSSSLFQLSKRYLNIYLPFAYNLCMCVCVCV